MFRAVWLLLTISCVSAQKLSFEDYMKAIDEEYGVLNSAAANLAWRAATKPKSEIGVEINKLNELRAEWKITNCERFREFWPYRFGTSRSVQQLCRGAMYSPSEARNISRVLSGLREIYQNTEVCVDGFCGHIEPDLARLMEQSDDPTLLLKLWFFWRKAIGSGSRPLYMQLVSIMNTAARRNGYSDIGEAWRDELGIINLEEIMENMFDQILPLYKALHAVVRFRLREHYGDSIVPAAGPIPAHLLGNMWGQSWTRLFPIVYKKTSTFNITERLVEKKLTVDDLVRSVEDFYVSLGFPLLTKAFWEHSKWQNTEGMCHGTSVNMYKQDDFRILLCASVNEEDFHIFFHEIGHIQYFMAYQGEPHIFQDGANSAMHETVGEAIAMAAFSPKNLRRLGILQESDSNTDLQHLLYFGLKLLPQIPYSLMIDKWRWAVFRGDIGPDHYNKGWWEMRKKYQGIYSPVSISEKDFDPASKFHVSDNVPYARYFIASILQVQIFDAMCKFSCSKRSSLLHECDIYGMENSTIGLRAMMKKGSSIDFETALKMVVNGTLSVEPLLRFFQPLQEWVKNEINRYSIPVGWDG